jgi:multiple sugar transport system substrate-binding protein
VPDLFYVNQAYSQDWIDQGLLAPLDQMATDAGFDMTAFYPNYLSPFQRDGQTYAFPKDSSVLGMQTNDQMLTDAGVEIPTTTEELVTAAQAVKDAGIVEFPMCFAGEWQRAGAFVHGHGGGIVDESGANTFNSPETLAGLQWYLDQYEAGLAATPADLGAGWCGEALGRGLVAFAFEGNWVGPAMRLGHSGRTFSAGDAVLHRRLRHQPAGGQPGGVVGAAVLPDWSGRHAGVGQRRPGSAGAQ